MDEPSAIEFCKQLKLGHITRVLSDGYVQITTVRGVDEYLDGTLPVANVGMHKRNSGAFDVTYAASWGVRGEGGLNDPIWDTVSGTNVLPETLDLHKLILDNYLTGDLDLKGLNVEARSMCLPTPKD